jgi:hypothetical protein
MDLILHSIREDQPGPRWQVLFERYWPAYQQWFLSQGHQARPGYLTSVKKLRQYMPELLPITATVERQEFLARRRADPKETASRFIRRFLQPPLYQTHYEEAFGTLYTAAYYPRKRSVDYSWPNQPKLCQSFAHFTEQTTSLRLKERHLQLATLAEK